MLYRHPIILKPNKNVPDKAHTHPPWHIGTKVAHTSLICHPFQPHAHTLRPANGCILPVTGCLFVVYVGFCRCFKPVLSGIMGIVTTFKHALNRLFLSLWGGCWPVFFCCFSPLFNPLFNPLIHIFAQNRGTLAGQNGVQNRVIQAGKMGGWRSGNKRGAMAVFTGFMAIFRVNTIHNVS